ncbi:MAG: hypothetical protein IPK42_25110 [Betaproteobacteria bacterium]|nr:hypothetical protein [Betaproteobacteria bacterium]
MAADVKTHLYEWSTTESSNLPVGSTVVSTNLDDNLRMIQKVVRDLSAPTTLAAGTSTDLGSKDETFITLTGSAATVTALGTVSAGIYKWVIFNAAHVLTHNGTSLILPSAANITAAIGDVACFVSLGSGNWRCVSYTRASGNNVLNASTFGDGTVGAPAITFAADLDTGFYRSGTNTVNVAAGGASVASFAAAVGITPTGAFSVSGGTTITLTPGAESNFTVTPALNAGGGGGGIVLVGGQGSTTGGSISLQPGAGGMSNGSITFKDVTTNVAALRFTAKGHLVGCEGGGLRTPAITSGAGTTPTIAGTDTAFKITLGTSPGTTAIVVDFDQTYVNAPMVIAQYQSDHIALRAVATTSGITITPASSMTAGHVIDVLVIGREES